MKATVSHFEIPARQIERAARFYQVVFGWRSEPRPWPAGPYRVFSGPAGDGGQPGIDGGLLQAREPLTAETAADDAGTRGGAVVPGPGRRGEQEDSAARGGPPARRPSPSRGAAGDPRAVHALEQPLLVIHLTGAPLQQCLDLIVAEGGEVELPVTEVGATGRFARFRDPEGNLLGLWQELDWAHPQVR
jgi:predicted enzyme related to lactoylglutathione lyase